MHSATCLNSTSSPPNFDRTDCFKKSCRKFEKVCRLEAQLKSTIRSSQESENQVATDVLNDIRVAALHYLVRDAKIPLVRQRNCPWHLPFHEYLFSNAPTYFRGDGGDSNKIFKDQIRAKYPCLSEHKIGLINPSQFSELLNKSCSHSEMKFYGGNYAYTLIQDCDDIGKFPQRAAIDVSTLLQKAYADGEQEFTSVVDRIKTQIEQLPEETVVTGMIKVDDGVGLYILFEPSQKRTPEVAENIHFGLFGLMKNFAGFIGAFPDMLQLKRAFIHQGFEIKTLLDAKTFEGIAHFASASPEINLKDHGLISEQPGSKEPSFPLSDELIACLQALLDNQNVLANSLASHYLSLLCRFVKAIMAQDPRSLGNDATKEVFYSAILDSQKKLLKLLFNIEQILAQSPSVSAKESFTKLLQELYLAFEEVSFLSIFFNTSHGDMETCLENAYPLPNEIASAGVQRSCYTFGSGMSSHFHVLDAYLSIERETPRNEKAKAVFIEGSYYELTDDLGLKDYLEDSLDTSMMSSAEFLTSEAPDCDVLLLDLHPNCASMKEVRSNPVAELVRTALNRRTDTHSPLTVVLDTTTGLFSESQIDDIIRQLTPAIAEGRLNFAISTSLAKFYNMGLDKHSGGQLLFYSASTNQFSDHMRDQLRSNAIANPISQESRRFYSLLFSTSKSEIEDYYQTIKQNTQYLYLSLRNELQQEGSSIHLGVKDPDVIVLGLHFDHFLQNIFPDMDEADFKEMNCRFVQLFKVYLFKKFIAAGLPVHLRRSFSFPNSSLTEFGTALRIAVGLEDNSILDQYAQHIKIANQELGQDLSPSLCQMIRTLYTMSPNEFKKMSELAITLLNDSQDCSFESFVEQWIALKEPYDF